MSEDDVTDANAEHPDDGPDPVDDQPGRAAAGQPSTDERVGDGVEHLQRAAGEMIAAARTFLDVVEDVVGDHAAVASLADALGSMSQVVVRAGTRARDAAAGSGPGATGPDDDGQGPRVQHIDVS